MLNKTILTGRIPDTDKINFELKNAENTEKSVIRFMLSVQRNYKPAGEQYYQEDLLPVVAFGHTAQFIGTYFKKGDFITVDGSLQKEKDYQDPTTGEPRRGQLIVNIDKAYFPGGGARTAEGTEKAAPAVAAHAPKRPVAAVKVGGNKSVLPGRPGGLKPSGGLRKGGLIS